MNRTNKYANRVDRISKYKLIIILGYDADRKKMRKEISVNKSEILVEKATMMRKLHKLDQELQ